jgi:hypothetical protein
VGKVIDATKEAERDSNERIAKIEQRAAAANARAAEANQKASEAQLAFEKLKTPRLLPPEQEKSVASNLKQFGAVPFAFWVSPEPEPVNLMNQLGMVLTNAGWEWKATNAGVTFNQKDKPHVGMTTLIGIKVQIDDSKRSEWERPVLELVGALIAAGIEANAEALPTGQITNAAISIRIGAKPM